MGWLRYLGTSLMIHLILVGLLWQISSGTGFRTPVIPVSLILTEEKEGRQAGGGGKQLTGRAEARKTEPSAQEATEERRGKSAVTRNEAPSFHSDDGPLKTVGREATEAKGRLEETGPAAPQGPKEVSSHQTSGAGGGGSTMVASLPGKGRGFAGEGSSALVDERLYGEIREQVMKNVEYPERARRAGIEGRVVASFTFREDGSITDVRIVNSSGSTVLDGAALKALIRSSFKQKRARAVSVVLPIEYKLK